MIGERIGHLRVIESIGVGGMGAVWHAVDELLDRHVALKVIRPELMSRPGLAERFRSEAIVLARLQHPCIAALYGLEKRGDEFVMVMEFVDGETLDSRLATQGRLPWPEATRITRAVLDALDHAHESGVIHRDIKPANVMITRAGRVKVMDFGIARLVGAQRQTRTGAAVGTPSYMSPEQLLGQEVDGRADVYAVGTLLYELTTGHLPFEVEGDYLRMIAQLQQVPSAPSTHQPDLPPGLDRIVARALQKEPDDRYATSGDFRDALEDLEREHGVLRPYGTPAAGSVTIPGATPLRGTPAVGAPEAEPVRRVNPAALLTPVESAQSATPVPFSIDPVSATPIENNVPSELVTAPAPAPMVPEPAVAIAESAPVAPVTTAPVVVAKRSAVPRAAMAVGGIAVVALAGVLLSRGVTASEKQAAAVAPPATPVAPAAPAAAAPTPAVAAPAVVTSDSVDSVARARVVKDSVRLAARRLRDSLRADSIEKARVSQPFALPGSTPSPQESAAAQRRAQDAGKRAASECVTALNQHDATRLESLLGGDRRREVIRIARDTSSEFVGPTGTAVQVDQDRVTASFGVNLTWQSRNGDARQARATMRAAVDRKGNDWSLQKCLVDNDGGARY